MIKETILSILADGDTSFTDLVQRIDGQIGGVFDGSIPWYVTTIKLDLEARSLIERVPNSSPQILRMAAQEV